MKSNIVAERRLDLIRRGIKWNMTAIEPDDSKLMEILDAFDALGADTSRDSDYDDPIIRLWNRVGWVAGLVRERRK